MYCCCDVAYSQSIAAGALVVFQDWTSITEADSYTAVSNQIAPYRPGHFYERELPVLLDLVAKVKEPIHTIIVDGFVWLDTDRAGLGQHLYEALQGKYAVIGVAKNEFADNRAAVPVLRGQSQKPLWVTTNGVDTSQACQGLRDMPEGFRIPKMLKLVDRICRDELSSAGN